MRWLYLAHAICNLVTFASLIALLQAIFANPDGIMIALMVTIAITSEGLGMLARHAIDTQQRERIEKALQNALQREMSRITPYGAPTQQTSALRLPVVMPRYWVRPGVDKGQTFHGIEQ